MTAFGFANAVRQWHAATSRRVLTSVSMRSAESVAASCAEAFATHERAHEPIGAYIKVLNLGCGIRRGLGSCLVSSLGSQCRLSARIMNVDRSAKAVAKEETHDVGPSGLARDSHTSQQQQCFLTWDAASGTPPPLLHPTLFSFGASTRYNLLVDNGSLDAHVGFGRSAEPLVAYLRMLRRCLREPSLDTSTPPLLVHLSADESRGELLAVAFPNDEHADERWQVKCDAVDVDAGVGRTFYRWAVHHSPLASKYGTVV